MIDRRRMVIRGVSAAWVAASGWLPVRAQRRPKRIAYLSAKPAPNEFEQAFERGLRERGYLPGGNLIIDYWFGAFDPARETANLKSALASQADVFVVGDALLTRGPRELSAAVPAAVYPALGDAVAAGVTSDLARPDGNITGTTVFAMELSQKRLHLLKQAVPEMKQAAALFNLRRRAPPGGVAATVKAGEGLGVKVMELGVALPEGLEDAIGRAARQGVQGVAVVSDTATIAHRDSICNVVRAHKLPAIYANRTYLRGGGLMSYGPDLEGAFYRAAHFVDRILRGDKPSQLPIEQPSSFQLVLNQKVAKAIGVKFSSELLLQATEVIE